MSLRISFGALEFLRGKTSYVHNGKDSLTTAFEIREEARVRILLPRQLGVVSVSVEIFNESVSEKLAAPQACWCGIEGRYDIYESDIDTVSLGVGLYFFRLRIESVFGTVFGYRSGSEICFGIKEQGQSFQLSICDFKYQSPEKKYGGIMYHIFVDRFAKGGDFPAKAGTRVVEDWSDGIPEYPAYPGAPLKNNTFYGGTLRGIREKLDYIASLGVDTIYLSPIFDAASNHKYDTGNYMHVDQMFGGDDELEALIKASGERGIGIILDGVFNHTGSDSLYFNKNGNYESVGAYQSADSDFYRWYDFQSHPTKYTCWWGIDILPRINPDIPDCGNYFVGPDGVIAKYAKLGIDGFRLDVADELSDKFISEIKRVLNDYNQQSLLYGEVWEDASNKIAYDKRKRYYLGSELDGVMNYPIRTGIIEYLKNRRCDSLSYALGDIINNAPKRIRDLQMNLLGTHDTERIITVLAGESSEGRSNHYLAKKRLSEEDLDKGLLKLMQAYTILSTVPGIPVIFYGDETALEGYHDPFNRMPYPWNNPKEDLINFYRKVGKIRRSNSVYKKGEFKLHLLTPDLLVFSRNSEDDCLLTVINNSSRALSVHTSKSAEALLSSSEKSVRFTVKANGAEIIKTEINSTANFYFI